MIYLQEGEENEEEEIEGGSDIIDDERVVHDDGRGGLSARSIFSL